MTRADWDISRPRPAPYYLGFRVLWIILLTTALASVVLMAAGF